MLSCIILSSLLISSTDPNPSWLLCILGTIQGTNQITYTALKFSSTESTITHLQNQKDVNYILLVKAVM